MKIQKIKGKIRINNWNEPVPVLALYKTQSILGEALTPEIIEIYKYTNGYELNWQIPSLLLEGEINIMPLEYMMAGKNGYFKSNWNTFLNYESITWHKHFTPVEMELVKGLRPFELLSLTPYIASLKDNEPQQIYFLDHTVLNLLLFDTKTYLEKALRYMGSTYWHFFEKEDFRIGDNQLLKDNLTKIENILNSNA